MESPTPRLKKTSVTKWILEPPNINGETTQSKLNSFCNPQPLLRPSNIFEAKQMVWNVWRLNFILNSICFETKVFLWNHVNQTSFLNQDKFLKPTMQFGPIFLGGLAIFCGTSLFKTNVCFENNLFYQVCLKPNLCWPQVVVLKPTHCFVTISFEIQYWLETRQLLEIKQAVNYVLNQLFEPNDVWDQLCFLTILLWHPKKHCLNPGMFWKNNAFNSN